MFHVLKKYTGFAIVAAGLFVALGGSPVQAQSIGDGCALPANSRVTPAKQTVITNLSTDANPASSFSCQNVQSITESAKIANCVSGLCDGGTNVMCCKPSTGAPLNVGSGSGNGAPTGPGTVGQQGGVGRLALPACVSDGNCGLDDLVTMAVNFSNFLFGISGAIALLIFVYAGFRLIFFAPDAGTVKEAKNMLVKATTGMIIIALAGILVTFLYNNLRGGSNSGTEARGSTCEEEVSGQPTGYFCTNLSSIPPKTQYDAYAAALRAKRCRPSERGTTNLCPGANSYCCPPGTTDDSP